MKPHLIKLTLFLILGAIVNVAVAWVLALTINSYEAPRVRGKKCSNSETWIASVWKCNGALSVFSVRVWIEGNTSAGFGPDLNDLVPSWTSFHQPIAQFKNREVEAREADARGWPNLALSSRIERNSLLDPLVTYGIETGLEHWTRFNVTGPPRVLPLRPIWPGFAINTIFYAAILWLLSLGPFTVRRMIRRKRGRCINCGYDLRGAEHEKCPECGNKCTTATI